MTRPGSREVPAADQATPPSSREETPDDRADAPTRRDARYALLALFLLAALATRFYRLGERPFHHDESIHAYQSYTLARNGTWRYDPAYHGPFLYYANALVYKTVGASDFTARLLPAIFGLLLIAFAWPLSRWIGREAAIAYALFILISPSLTYFSRFIREDLYSLVFTLGTIVAFRLFLETDRARWLTFSAVSFALAGVTKENAYMTGVLFVAFGLWVFLERVVQEKPREAAFPAVLKRTWDWIAAHFLPLFSAALLFLIIWTLMYTAFGKYPEDWLAIPKAVKYWMGQHAIARIPGPWYYHFPLLAYYETAVLVAALFAFRPGQTRASPFLRFVAFWAIGSLALYSWAREKVPWLMVHSLLPILILAAVGVAGLWRDRRELGPRLALAAILLLGLVNTSGMLLASFRYGAHDRERDPKHAEMLAYVQTSRELIRALAVVERAKERISPGESPIAVAGDASWPLTWYLRDTPTRWSSRIEMASTPVIVADWDPDAALEKQLGKSYDAKRVPIRSWWFPDIIRKNPDSTTPGPSLRQVLRWWLFHEIWNPIGSQDSSFFVRKDLAGSGQLEALRIEVKTRSAREYSAEPAVIKEQHSWGAPGNGRGGFAEPRGLAADGRGNLYVADTKNHRIQVFGPRGEFLREFGRKGSGEGELNEPCGLAADADGEVWVADTWNHRIVRFTPDGQFRASFGDPEKTLFGPRAVLLSRGSLYVADTGNKRIVRFSLEGKRIAAWGGDGTGPGQFIEPVGLAAGASGNIYVADTGNHRVQVFDPEGKFLRQFPVFGWKDFYTEPHIAVGPSETVFVTDSWGKRAAQYDSGGNLRRTWRGSEPFKSPTGIVLDPFGNLTVSDRGTHRLQTWSLRDLAP